MESGTMPNGAPSGRFSQGRLACVFGLLALGGIARVQPAELPPPTPAPQILTLEAAIHFALENNPAMAAQRQQRGIAAARVVIADTYPFNPILENRIQGAEGPQSGGITNRLPLEHILVWEVEVCHQGQYRREGAAAALSRTDWEIAHLEQSLAVEVIRTYVTLLYRQEKVRLIDETLRYNQQLVDDMRKQEAAGTRPAADRIVAETEVTDTLDLVAAGREALTVARQDLYRALGIVSGPFVVEGPLDLPPLPLDLEALTDLAVQRRADLQARRRAVAEAEANLRLVMANRFGNPIVGPAYTYDPSGVNSFGAQINVPLPVVNIHRGEILEARAGQAQAALLFRQSDVNVRQDVATAVARLEVAEHRARVFRDKSLPDLRKALDDLQKLFDANRPGADLTRLIDVRRKLLRARESYLDAVWAVRMVRADLLAAVGEPVLGLCSPPPP
jgi:outer membrane protein TolC